MAPLVGLVSDLAIPTTPIGPLPRIMVFSSLMSAKVSKDHPTEALTVEATLAAPLLIIMAGPFERACDLFLVGPSI